MLFVYAQQHSRVSASSIYCNFVFNQLKGFFLSGKPFSSFGGFLVIFPTFFLHHKIIKSNYNYKLKITFLLKKVTNFLFLRNFNAFLTLFPQKKIFLLFKSIFLPRRYTTNSLFGYRLWLSTCQIVRFWCCLGDKNASIKR